MPEPRTLLEYAIEYAQLGWHVLPVFPPDYPCNAPGKQPVFNDWPNRASIDIAEIEDWWTGRYRDFNIGIATGYRSGIFVVDIDDDGINKRGEDTLTALVAQFGALPDTPTVLTPSGGRHLYFRYPGFNLAGRLGDWIDMRGDGAQVVAPPSRHRTGGLYLWEHSAGIW